MQFKENFITPVTVVLLLASQLLFACNKTATDQPLIQQPDTIPPAAVGKTYLALGDSYTIGQSVPPSERFPVQAVALLRDGGFKMEEPHIIATTGWTTANLLEAIKEVSNTKKYDVLTLLIGVNNQYQGRSIAEYKTEFTALLEKSIEFTANKPGAVIVLSIPDYSVTPYAEHADRQKIATEIDAFNKVNKEVSEQYKVNYIDITGESRKAAVDPSLVASDRLHFSGKAYHVWAQLLVPVMKNILR
jgi:lysophospholipase L1-like esterase